MIELIISVEGMKCGMCESHVNDVVRRVDGVKKVYSSHKKNHTIVVAEDTVDTQSILDAIKAQGYGVGGVQSKSFVKRGLFGWKK